MPPSRTSDDIPKFMNRFTNARSALFQITGWQPILVLLLALTIRVVYNLFFFQHRICDIGDSSYYLTAGKALADLIRASWSETHLSDFLVRLCQPTTVIPGSFQSFSSTNLSDRLLLDGPIFPSYLAGLFLLIGAQTGAAANLALNAHSQFYAIANSVVDSFSCALVCAFTSLAFGRKTGLLAGIGLALYAPSIINTQQCYGEPFAYFLLCCWALLLVLLGRSLGLGPSTKSSASPDLSTNTSESKLYLLNCFLLALFSGLLMLAKPAFVFLPWLGIAVFLVAIYIGGSKHLAGINKSKLLLAALSFVMGLALALAPWLGFTRSVSGQMMLVVNRAPQYNLYIGNYLASDGWKTWPTQPNIPNTMADAKAFVMDEFKTSPLALIGLFLRKIARLTVGVWNEFQYPLGLFGIVEQNIWQGVLLLLASFGLAATLNKEDRTAKALALAFASIILFHLVYACFEPVPRYAITAMPLVMAFAAQGLLTLCGALTKARSGNQRGLLFSLVGWVLLGFNWLYRFASPVAAFALVFDACSFAQIRMLVALCWCAYFVWLFAQLVQILSLSHGYANLSRLAVGSLVASATLTVLCTAAFFLQDPALSECSTLLVAGGPGFTDRVRFPLVELEQELQKHPLSGPLQSYLRQLDCLLLVDCETTAPPPVLVVSVNGRSFPAQTALMWNELLPSEKDVPIILDLQSRAMSADKRKFRQWWAVPFSTSALRNNQVNELTLSVPAGSQSVRVFADWVNNSTNPDVLIPSLTKFSWTKGFLTFDNRDSRPYELRPSAPLALSELKSSYFAKLKPQMRLHLAIPRMPQDVSLFTSAANDTSMRDSSKSILNHLAEHVVAGCNPRSFKVQGPVFESGLAANLRFDFSFEVGKSKTKKPVEVDLAFSGTKGGQPIAWRSQWQPACIEAGPDWKKYTYSNLLPADFDQWRNVTCTVSMSPFIADQLYLHPKEAQRAQMTVRNLRVEVSPSGLPSGELKWAMH